MIQKKKWIAFVTTSVALFSACLGSSENPGVGQLEQSVIVENQSWTVHPSDVVGARFGEFFAGGFDSNGDGFGDVIATAPQWGDTIGGEGRAYLFLGSERGLPTIASWVSDPTNREGADFGPAAGLGDVNGDGFGDFAILSKNEGFIYLYLGNAEGMVAEPAPRIAAVGATIVSAAGDINGDGYADMVTGSPEFSGDANGEGKVTLYFGSPDGFMDETISLDPTNQLGAGFGGAVASAGDVNGDGFGDLVVGAAKYSGTVLNEGRMYLYFGAAEQPQLAWSIDPTDQNGSGFGFSVSSAGDVDGDGFAEILVSAPGYSDTVSGRGQVFLLKGGPADFSAKPENRIVLNSVDQEAAAFGYSLSGAGDVNGDGYSDVVIGVPSYNAGDMLPNVGKILLFLGGASGLDTELGGEGLAALGAGAHFGYHVASAGDVNGDGLSDILSGANGASGGVMREGVLLGFYGEAPLDPGNALPPRDREYRQEEAGGTTVLRDGVLAGAIAFSAKLVQMGTIGGGLRLEVEVKPFETPFDALELKISEAVPGGQVARVVWDELAAGAYHWRARTVYPVGSGRGPWFSFDEIGPLNPVVDGQEPVDPLQPSPDFRVSASANKGPDKLSYYDCSISVGTASSKSTSFFFFLLALLVLGRIRKRE